MPVFEKVNFDVNQGDFFGILGPNGAGKTTLVEMFISMRWPDTGVLTILGVNSRDRKRDYLDRVTFLSHDIQLNENQTIKQFLEFNSFFYPKYSVEVEGELLEFFQLNKLKKIHEHSTGQKKKIQIVGALAALTELIVIDEVTAVLDPGSRNKFFIKLKEHNEKYKTSILLATNVVDDLKNYAQKILYIDKGHSVVTSPDSIDQLFGVKNV